MSDLKKAVTSVVTETVGLGLKQSTLPRKPWITGEMINTSVRIGKKKNRNALSPNAEGVRQGAEDGASKARGVSL